MIPRYTRPAMGRLWSEESKLATWLEVELAAVEAVAEAGLVPREAAQQLRARAKLPTPQRVAEIERDVRHDMIAFTMAVTEGLPEEARDAGRYLHFGLTSSDVLDTGLALQLRSVNALLLEGLQNLADSLTMRAYEFKDTICIGRTHGVHAEPTTFGLKLALWFGEARRNKLRLEHTAEELRVGKISGAVGTYAHLGPEIEQRICNRLGLAPAPVSSQIIQRDRHAYYLATLAVIAASLEKIALEIRHLQRTEVREAEEPFGAAQRGSSAMPHKRNPVVSEQICGLARVVRANAQAALENVALWHERDISHSSVERIILPDSTILVDYLLAKTAGLVENLVVYPERMKANLESSRGMIFSEAVLLALINRGVAREIAYSWVQSAAKHVWEEGREFKDAVLAHAQIAENLGVEEIEKIFDLKQTLRHVDAVFQRVFRS
jgi:adenylosuccinate lyase